MAFFHQGSGADTSYASPLATRRCHACFAAYRVPRDATWRQQHRPGVTDAVPWAAVAGCQATFSALLAACALRCAFA